MKIEVKDQGAVSVLHVKGNLTGGPETLVLHEEVKAQLAQKRTKLVLDLAEVAWINSTGLGVLMGCLTSVKNAGGDLKLSGINDKVKNLFVITKLITLFDVFEKVPEAVESLGA
jgi:anti-sigma B factor antagonist